MKFKNRISLKWPEIIFLSVIFLVFLSFLLFYLIDLRNWLGLRDYLFSLNNKSFDFFYFPLFFINWGRNGGIAEIIQAVLLASSALTSAFIASYERFKSKKKYYFWLLLAISFSLMLIEDASEVRMTIVSYVQAYFGEIHQGVIGSFVEFIYFSILASIPIYTILYYGKFLLKYKKTRIYIVIGFSLYFLAASLSFLGRVVAEIFVKAQRTYYGLLGENLYNFFLKIGDSNLTKAWENDLYYYFNQSISQDKLIEVIYFLLLDNLIEENIELIAASAFLAACVSFLIYQNKERKYSNNKQELK